MPPVIPRLRYALCLLALLAVLPTLRSQPIMDVAHKTFADNRNAGLPALVIDLTRATVVAPAASTGPEKKAVAMLIEDVEALWEPIAAEDDWSAFEAKMEHLEAARLALAP